MSEDFEVASEWFDAVDHVSAVRACNLHRGCDGEAGDGADAEEDVGFRVGGTVHPRSRPMTNLPVSPHGGGDFIMGCGESRLISHHYWGDEVDVVAHPAKRSHRVAFR